MGQKMSDIFFQYQDFLKSRYPGFFKTRFLPVSKLAYFSLFSSTEIFQKIFGYRKIPVLEKVKKQFFARNKKSPMGCIALGTW
jgi:hypothetical protein